ncbi:urocanate hydratase [Babesia caballi]|uniref:Urocanate hydratase n=1 Tax=Babesia caballi TaxID=5871 RepID=A0AAV4M0K4_BABCB|nr:urocanate hydratase [Babesia caballi]
MTACMWCEPVTSLDPRTHLNLLAVAGGEGLHDLLADGRGAEGDGDLEKGDVEEREPALIVELVDVAVAPHDETDVPGGHDLDHGQDDGEGEEGEEVEAEGEESPAAVLLEEDAGLQKHANALCVERAEGSSDGVLFGDGRRLCGAVSRRVGGVRLGAEPAPGERKPATPQHQP